jgi:hypothetical protein
MIGTGTTVGAALTDALLGGAPEPQTLEDIGRAYGDAPRERNSLMAREATGLPQTGPLPPRGTVGRRQYNSERDRVRRYFTGARHPAPAALDALRRGARLHIAARQLARARAHGLGLQLLLGYWVSKTFKTGTLPPGGPAHIAAQWVRPALNAWTSGNAEEAGAILLAAFFGHDQAEGGYWDAMGNEDPDEDIVDIQDIFRAWVHL